jgi:hypothetical protein
MSEATLRSENGLAPEDAIHLMRLFAELAEFAAGARTIIRDGAVATTLLRLQPINGLIAERLQSIREIAQR